MAQRLDDLADACTMARYRLQTAERMREEAVSAERTARYALQGHMLANGIQRVATEEAVYTMEWRPHPSRTTYPALTTRERRKTL